jgi:outer membrane protein assembly factor BamA
MVIEPQAITSDQSNTLGQLAAYRNFGLAASAQFSDKNVFHGAEIFSLRLRTAIEAQGGSSINNSQFFNSNEYSLTASLSLPRLVFLKKFDRKLLQSSTKTIITNSIIYETNLQYKRTVFTTGLTYQINKKLYSYNFSPLEISYINTSFANAELEARSKSDILLQNIFANNLITDSRFGLTYSDKPLSKDGSYFYWRWDVLEVAGTSITAINELLGTQKDEKGQYKLFGVNYYQYAKTYMDARWNKVLDINNSVHFRVAGGYALPYGNSPNFITYEKRFFTGGANSIRAFRPRSVGPGTFDTINQIDRSGEVKLELNLEYRFNIYKRLFEGALFTDAGNVWTAKDDGRDGAAFKFDRFVDQVAIGSGVGVRLNLNIFIFRLDAAVPIKDPRLSPSQRWVLEKYKDLGVMWENTILNFGVGYPF